MQPNLIKLLDLVDRIFQTRNDPTQIGFSDQDMAKMSRLHTACLQEAENEEGPIAWVAVIPTSQSLMHEFIDKAISERELFDLTTPETPKQVVYLCSAIVLPEFRASGVAMKLSLNAIHAMQQQWKISAAFVWPFSNDGEMLARSIARRCEFELFIRPHN